MFDNKLDALRIWLDVELHQIKWDILANLLEHRSDDKLGLCNYCEVFPKTHAGHVHVGPVVLELALENVGWCTQSWLVLGNDLESQFSDELAFYLLCIAKHHSKRAKAFINANNPLFIINKLNKMYWKCGIHTTYVPFKRRGKPVDVYWSFSCERT